MIIYAIEVRGDITSYEWVVVTIWKNKTDALDEMTKYRTNCHNNGVEMEYRVKELDTDNECIYDYQKE